MTSPFQAKHINGVIEDLSNCRHVRNP